MIAFYGMGLLGSNFVRAYLRRGEGVRVWNRTPDKARALAEAGAIVCDDPAEAARGASRVHLTLSDDAAVDDVLERASPGFAAGVVVVDHTTTSKAGTRARIARLRERGVDVLHAPVFMGPQNALEGTGVMLASGAPELLDKVRGDLEKMTGRLVYLGPQDDKAASFKLLGNLFLMFMTAGIAEVLTLAKAMDIKPEEASSIFDTFNPAVVLGARVKRVLGADFEHPSWELAMARKDARLMLEEGDRGGVPLTMLPAIAAVMDRYLALGHAHDDWTVIAKDALTPRA